MNYFVSVQTPLVRINTLGDISGTPLGVPSSAAGSPSEAVNATPSIGGTPSANSSGSGLSATVAPQPTTPSTISQASYLGAIASVTPGTDRALISHHDVQSVVDIQCNVVGRDLGGVSSDIRKIIDEAKSGKLGPLPKGVTIALNGQADSMARSFRSLALGLVVAIVLVYLLMVVLFQSWIDPLIIIAAVPGALVGILWMLVLTKTTLNVESLMGSIMAVGIAVSNSILLVNFANDVRVEKNLEPKEAALEAGKTRLRPVLMTALAMILGMLPMALGLGEGGEQNAPLGRAVIGGLLVATFATLFVVPLVYSRLRVRPPRKHELDAEFASASRGAEGEQGGPQPPRRKRPNTLARARRRPRDMTAASHDGASVHERPARAGDGQARVPGAAAKHAKRGKTHARPPSRPHSHPPSRGHGRLFNLVAVSLVLLSSLAIGGLVVRKHIVTKHAAEARAAEVDRGPHVLTVRAKPGPGTHDYTLAAEARGYFQTTAYAKVSGYVREVRVDKGDHVKKGQILGTVDSPETDNAVRAAQSDVALRKQLFDRAKVFGPDVMSLQDLQTAASNFKVSSSSLASALALQSYETIRAPFDGTVTMRYVDPGALMPAATGSTSSAQPFVDIADPTKPAYLGLRGPRRGDVHPRRRPRHDLAGRQGARRRERHTHRGGARPTDADDALRDRARQREGAAHAGRLLPGRCHLHSAFVALGPFGVRCCCARERSSWRWWPTTTCVS